LLQPQILENIVEFGFANFNLQYTWKYSIDLEEIIDSQIIDIRHTLYQDSFSYDGDQYFIYSPARENGSILSMSLILLKFGKVIY
jgi:hypothetical protein